MELRTAASPRDVKHYTTERLREEFLIDDLFQPDVIKLVYSHIDRIITGSAVPVKETLKLTAGDELRAQYFCERRELGVINIGGAGVITIDGKEYKVAHKEGMYIGMGSKDISFASENADSPAKFYLNSAPAHMTYPTVLIKPEGTPEDGVVIVKEEKDLEPALCEVLKYSGDILVEQYIEGREFTNAVFLDRALPSVEIIPHVGGYDYSNKYVAGATEEICPGRLSEEKAKEMGEMALAVHRALGLRTYSRSDFMVDKDDNLYFLEVNTLPGMTPTSLVPQEAAAVGISYEDLCDQIVQDALRYAANQKK